MSFPSVEVRIPLQRGGYESEISDVRVIHLCNAIKNRLYLHINEIKAFASHKHTAAVAQRIADVFRAILLLLRNP